MHEIDVVAVIFQAVKSVNKISSYLPQLKCNTNVPDFY